MPCGGKKRRRGKVEEQVFASGFLTSAPTDLGEIQTVTAGYYPEVPPVELPDHLKPSYLRPREIDMLKQP